MTTIPMAPLCDAGTGGSDLPIPMADLGADGPSSVELELPDHPFLGESPLGTTALAQPPSAGYNRFVTESILILDVRAACPGTQVLPGCVWVDSALPIAEAAPAARQLEIDELTPDNSGTALLLVDAAECRRAQWVHDWLRESGLCSEVIVVEWQQFEAAYPFLIGLSVGSLRAYPNEIRPGLFLGSKATTNQTALAHLQITHVLSIVDRDMPPPDGTVHKLLKIADDESADLTPVMREALPFIGTALAGGGRILVHCDRGASRSASVVAAHLMREERLDLSTALEGLKRQRSCVGPNAGFLRSLRERRWEEPLAIDSFEYVHGSRKRTAQAAGTPQVSADQHEISIKSSWAALLDEAGGDAQQPLLRPRALEGEPAQTYADGGGTLVVLENLFSPTECARLLQAADAVGFGRTSYPKAYRGNLRLITEDKSLTDAVWARVRHVLPASIDFEGATWDAVGLNECWRLAKYHPGDRFGAHVDAFFQRSDDEQSFYTVNVYMNAVPREAGGSTRFYAGGGSRFDASREQEPVLTIAPEAGLAVIFRQPPAAQLLHDGEQLKSGLKYLFRSDVMFRRRGAPLSDRGGDWGGLARAELGFGRPRNLRA